MNIGCFALVHPFQPLDAQLAQIAEWGFKHADVTDNCDGASLGVEFVKKFGTKIEHVHWKDMPAEMASQRGTRFGCGMASIALGEGVVGIADVVRELKRIGFNGHTTLEVAGERAVLASRDYLLSIEVE